MKMPEHCRKCKLYQQLSPEGSKKTSGVCLAGYKNPPQSVEAAYHQLLRGGEYPCSKSPVRGKFKMSNKFWLGNKVMNIKYIQPLHFRTKEDGNEE